MFKKFVSALLAVAMLAAFTVTASAANNHSESAMSVFEYGYVGVGDDGNTYYMAYDANIEFAAFVILSEDGSQSINVVGETEANGQYLTIKDSGYSITFMVEDAGDDAVLLTLKDGTEVAMVTEDVDTVIEYVLAIDEGTEIVNPAA